MKKILFTLILMFGTLISTNAQQNNEYPKLIKNEYGTFITFTVAQANHINNMYDLNAYMDSLIAQLDSRDSIYVSLLDTSNTIIAKFKIIVDTQNAKIKNYDDIVENFGLILDGYRRENNLLSNHNVYLNKSIKKLKLYMYTSMIINAGLLYILITK